MNKGSETEARKILTRSQSSLQDSPLYTLEQVQEIVERAVAASTERILEAHNAKISALQDTISSLDAKRQNRVDCCTCVIYSVLL